MLLEIGLRTSILDGTAGGSALDIAAQELIDEGDAAVTRGGIDFRL